MNNIAPTKKPISVGQAAEFFSALGVTPAEVQRVITSRSLSTQVRDLIRGGMYSVELAEAFDDAAMKHLIDFLLRGDPYKHFRDGNFKFSEGVQHLHDLATTAVVKSIMDGMSQLQVAVTVERGGLNDGLIVPATEVARRLGLSGTKEVASIRGQANAYMRKVLQEKYPLAAPEPTSDTTLDDTP